jgi:hypothetical protein
MTETNIFDLSSNNQSNMFVWLVKYKFLTNQVYFMYNYKHRTKIFDTQSSIIYTVQGLGFRVSHFMYKFYLTGYRTLHIHSLYHH